MSRTLLAALAVALSGCSEPGEPAGWRGQTPTPTRSPAHGARPRTRRSPGPYPGRGGILDRGPRSV